MSIEEDRIEKLKRTLYSRTKEPVLDVRSPVAPKDVSMQSAWGTTQLEIPDDMPTRTHAHPLLKKFLWTAGIFFLVSVCISAYIFFGGGNSISSSNVDIQVAGPSTVASGEEVDLSVSLINQNHADMELVSWTVDYPDGSYGDKDSTQKLGHTQETIGTIAKGSAVNRTVKLFLFGDKGATKPLMMKLTYQVSGSNAIFTKEKEYDLTIGSSPIILNVSAPADTVSGQDLTLQATVSSNASSLLHNVLVSVQYPYGFTYESSTLTPVPGNTTLWNVGDLKSGDTKKFSITGKLSAQDGEQRVFQFAVGTKSTDPNKDIDTVLGQASPLVTVSKPSIDAKMTLSNSTADAVAVQSGQNVSGEVSFANTLPESLTNVSVQVRISGNGFDSSSVTVDNNGFYQSGTGSISWDKNSYPVLASVDPGDVERLGFGFIAKKVGTNEKNPQVTFTTTVKGTRISSSGVVDTVSTSATQTAKISARMTLASRTLQMGAFANSGRVPPKAESPTTYTIDWVLSNMWNDLSGVTVTTVLPTYVEWTGNIAPSNASVTYNPDNRTVTWSPGTLSAGAGFSVSPKVADFQVRILPSVSQVGNSPSLTSGIAVSGTDMFSGANISFTNPALTTQTADTNNNGIVTK